jgi:hypothetical protein
MIQCYHLFSLHSTDDANWPADHLPFLFCLVVLLCLVVFCLFVFALVGYSVLFLVLGCVFSVGIVTACRTLYRSCLSSLLKSTIVKMDDNFALIDRICQYATGLQAWWTTWRKPWRRWTEKKIHVKVIHLYDGQLQKWTEAGLVQSPLSCHDANRKNQTNQTKKRNKTQTNHTTAKALFSGL